jgi:hypothetical protein
MKSILVKIFFSILGIILIIAALILGYIMIKNLMYLGENLSFFDIIKDIFFSDTDKSAFREVIFTYSGGVLLLLVLGVICLGRLKN